MDSGGPSIYPTEKLKSGLARVPTTDVQSINGMCLESGGPFTIDQVETRIDATRTSFPVRDFAYQDRAHVLSSRRQHFAQASKIASWRAFRIRRTCT